jgi:nucleotide-binding universal stress UspA family protein
MKVLLALDDSEFSRGALRAVLTRFRRENTELRLIHVIEPVFSYISDDTGILLLPSVAKEEAKRRKRALAVLRSATRVLREGGFKVGDVLDEGDPKQAILSHAEKWKPDLIVVGSHGRTGLGRFLLGSVSEAVVRHANCSVLVARIKGLRAGVGGRSAATRHK